MKFLTMDEVGLLPDETERPEQGTVAAGRTEYAGYTDEQVLGAAVLEQAVIDARRRDPEAIAWFDTPDFEALCDRLNVEAAYFRRKLREEGILA